MEPKFQSSFIPKGPVSTAGAMQKTREVRKGGLYSYAVMVIFIISVALGVGVFAYKLYTRGTINRMSEEIAERRDTLIPSASLEYIRLNTRIQSLGGLLANHVVTSPLFDYLEASTLRTVRFTEFTYNTAASGVELAMEGRARSYADIALQADIFNQGGRFKNPIFSDFTLDEAGNVNFTLKTTVDQNLISYSKQIESASLNEKAQSAVVATSTPVVATSTSSTVSTSTATSTSSTSSPQAPR